MAELAIAKMFRSLRKQGFIAKRHFWCCQSCAWADLAGESDTREAENIAFMHQQDEDCWRENGYSYIAWSGNGQAIVDAATESGLKAEWDGTTATRIKITNPNFVVDNYRRAW